MALENNLNNWVAGPPMERDDGSLAIIELAPGVTVDGQDHYGHPIIVSRWSGKLKTTAGAHRLSYDDVTRHIDIAGSQPPMPGAAHHLAKVLASIPQQPQRQDGTNDQLADLVDFANRLGLYDAADYINSALKRR